MNDAMQKEDRRAVGGYPPATDNGVRNHFCEPLPGKDRVTVRGVPEKTKAAAVSDAESSAARLRAFSAGAFATEPLLDSDQAAAIMQIHPKTLQKLARSGEIRGLQIGKAWRFRASVLDEWIQQKLAG
jgi:excisionase family DNA binding protein